VTLIADLGVDITASDTPDAKLVEVSHDQARRWLEERNIDNRSLTSDRAQEYAEQIRTGTWALNGDTVRFARPEGGEPPRLLDGQHRLEAIALSGTTVRTFLVVGLDPTSQDTMDQGTVRSGAQVLGMHHIPNPNTTRAAAQLVWAYKKGVLGEATSRKRRAAVNILVPFVKEHQTELAQAVAQGSALRRHHTGTVGTAAAAYYILHEAGPGRIGAFWGDLMDGGGRTMGHPVWTIRRALIKEAETRRKAQSRIVLAWYIQAWNAYNADRGLEKVSWAPDRHAFPLATVVTSDG